MSDRKNELDLIKKDVVDVVESRIKELKEQGEFHFPANYSPENAMKSAWLILQNVKDKSGKKALEVCDRNSIANALFDMVIQGLSPAKKQCYFVAYGNQLQLMRSYMGTVAVTKRLNGVKDVKAYCIYEGDEFETEYNVDTATLKITKFKPKFENIDITKIKGAFAIVVGEDGPLHTEIMNITQIRNAWNQGSAKGKSGAHTNFAEEMAKKTVINRACKMFANTSDDSDLLIEAFNKATENEYENNPENQVKQEIEEKANKKTLGFEKEKVQDVKYEAVELKETSEDEPQKETTEQMSMGPGF